MFEKKVYFSKTPKKIMLRLLKKGWMPRICEVPTALPGKIVTVSYSLQSLNALDVSVHRSIIYKMILHHPKECRCRDIIKHGQPISCRAPLPRDTRYQVHSSRISFGKVEPSRIT